MNNFINFLTIKNSFLISPYLVYSNYYNFKNLKYFLNLKLNFYFFSFLFKIENSFGLIYKSNFKNFLNQPIKILNNENYNFYNKTQFFTNFNISNCYFQNIISFNSGGGFFISNINIDIFINNCYFENIYSYGSSINPMGRTDCGGGGFCVFSSKCFLKNLCFLNCNSNFVGPSFHSCSNENQNNEFNLSTLIKTFTSYYNSWSEDRGNIINNEINNTNSITLNALTLGHRSGFNFGKNIFILIFNCSANKFIIGDSGILSNPSKYEFCNIILNNYSNSLFYKYSECLHSFFNCFFIENPIETIISGPGNSIYSFIECF